jgi:hypothetical protein
MVCSKVFVKSATSVRSVIVLFVAEGDGLQAVRYHRKAIAALAAEGRSLSWKEFPQGPKPIELRGLRTS